MKNHYKRYILSCTYVSCSVDFLLRLFSDFRAKGEGSRMCQPFAEHRQGRSLPSQTPKVKDKRKVGCYADNSVVVRYYLENIYTLLG
jgi:hypothetical protein